MVSKQSVEAQLKKINFNTKGWGRSETGELSAILLDGETIYECVNGLYDGGFALLVATDVRLLLVDKKPLNYLTVEDLRFDMINEIDYNHRLFGAYISVSTGSKNLRFTSVNQPRLRKLIGHVQHCMAEAKKKQSEHQEDQNQHLERLNKQLREYLKVQQEEQQRLRRQATQDASPTISDADASGTNAQPSPIDHFAARRDQQAAELYAEGVREVFGKRQTVQQPPQPISAPLIADTAPASAAVASPTAQELDALRVAYAKLPMAMRNRRFGRPSFHAHSQATAQTPAQATAA